ncbi:MAG: HAMP domain-containing histidine kinase [Gemmatimonadetes bacterium]|nr:HAMP domain-containing histidine kinase [Gemmatimonadota bacterium]
MTVRTRLVLSLACTIALLVIPAVYGVSQLATLRNIAEELQGRHAAAFLALGGLQRELAELNRFERSYIAAPSEDQRVGMHNALINARTQLARLGAAGYSAAVSATGRRLDAIDRATQRIEELVQSGHVNEAAQAFETLKPALAAVQDSLDDIARAIDHRSQGEVDRARSISATATTTMLGGLIVALLITLLLGLWTTDAFTRPLRKLRRTMATVAGGEFVVPGDLPYRREDEIGDLARSFRSMTQRLAELDRLKAEFISIATHELKTPINVVGGYTELLEDGIYGDVNEKQREVLGAVHEQTRVLTRLVNQLLDISRLEAGGLRMEVEVADLHALLGEVERAFDPLARQRGIELQVEVDPSTPQHVPIDAPRIRDQLLGNLLSNALKFTPTGGRIRVLARGAKDSVHLTVTDTGVGIPPQQLAHIFEKYYQVGAEARTKGAGLGLSIAREVAEAHGGRISVESAPGRGTSFQIVLPIRQPSPAPAALPS